MSKGRRIYETLCQCPEQPCPRHVPVPIPERLRQRPMEGIYPVPYLVTVIDGTPDFRVTDMERWAEVVKGRLCSLCGQPNDYWLYFIGGDISMLETRLFFDPPTHHECALYALKVCPYLATPRDRSYRAVRLPGVEIVTKDKIQQNEKPDKFGLGKTRGYTVVEEQGHILVKAKPWVSLTWWRNGESV